MEDKRRFIFVATGDVGVNRDNCDSMFDGVRDVLNQADLVFGDCESPITNRGSPLPQSRLAICSPPRSADAIRRAGYDIMTFANNHCMDYGIEGFTDTLENLRRVGILQVGAGNNIEDARKPVIWTLDDGTKLGFLAYSSICPQNFWADDLHCGFAPMRALTAFEAQEHDQPETAQNVFSFPHPEDLDAMLSDIQKLRSKVDILILSLHWGVHFTPASLGWYQRYISYFAVNAGVDIILGHHAHIMKPIEVYKGVPIIYCMPNFAFEGPQVYSPIPLEDRKEHAVIAARNPETAKNPKKQMPTDSYKSFFVKCIIEKKRIQKVSICPCQLDDVDCRPEVLHREDPRFQDIYQYLLDITKNQKLDTEYRIEGNEICII